MMTANEIRSKFLDFFKSKGHTIVKSDTLVPKDDPTVLFTTAGMQQFKRQFLGDVGDTRRAASSQKCLRTDDLDKVGRTDFHHTFFEMLGNFSFGDYFKKEAITWAWEFLTVVLGIPSDRLWASIYKEDTEAEGIWLKEIRIPKERLVRLGDKSNFWPSEAKTKGPNGPCGPCSEIFYDYGVNPDCKLGDRCNPDCDCGRFSEIWNLVFTQFNRRDEGVLEPLPSKNIDTGMGLERLVAVMQGKHNNFETDLFVPIIAAIDKETGRCGYTLDIYEKRVIADHIRAIVFAINDGVMPSNKGRGNVVKRLINDATDMMMPAGKNKAALVSPVPTVVDVMKQGYPDLAANAETITGTVQRVQESFLDTRNRRIPELKTEITQAKDLPGKERITTLGKIFFNYRDTYGLTIQTILSAAESLGIAGALQKSALAEYETLMRDQQERSRASSKMAGDVFTDADLDLSGLPKTEFEGYEQAAGQGRIVKLFKDGEETGEARKDDPIKIVLDRTPFYAESGGQIGDQGELIAPNGKIHIEDTIRIGDIFVHAGTVAEGTVKIHDNVEAAVDASRRLSIMRNHTATHLLQAALRKILGSHVQQQGSVVDDQRLRFDFTHPKGLTDKQTKDIEEFVNRGILEGAAVTKETLSLEEARKKGALAFFAEKYGETVRVVSVGDYSKELCGGTHLDNTGQIGLFKIVSESAIAQGIRRIEARTGWGAYALVSEEEEILGKAAQALKAPKAELADRVLQQTERIKKLEKELESYRIEAVKNSLDGIILKAETAGNTKIIAHIVPDAEAGMLKKIADMIRQKVPSTVIVLGAGSRGSASVLTALSDDLVKKGLRADDLIKEVAPLINGSGGGRPQLAQAGSKDATNLEKAVRQAAASAKQRLKS